LRLRASADWRETCSRQCRQPYPVSVGGKNYTGSKPPLWRSPWLKQFARRVLAPELCALAAPVIVPLGRTVEKLLDSVEADGSIATGGWGAIPASVRSICKAAAAVRGQ